MYAVTFGDPVQEARDRDLHLTFYFYAPRPHFFILTITAFTTP